MHTITQLADRFSTLQQLFTALPHPKSILPDKENCLGIKEGNHRQEICAGLVMSDHTYDEIEEAYDFFGRVPVLATELEMEEKYARDRDGLFARRLSQQRQQI